MNVEHIRPTFKLWAKSNGICTIRLSNGEYNSKATRAAWKAFQAAFSLFAK